MAILCLFVCFQYCTRRGLHNTEELVLFHMDILVCIIYIVPCYLLKCVYVLFLPLILYWTVQKQEPSLLLSFSLLCPKCWSRPSKDLKNITVFNHQANGDTPPVIIFANRTHLNCEILIFLWKMEISPPLEEEDRKNLQSHLKVFNSRIFKIKWWTNNFWLCRAVLSL